MNPQKLMKTFAIVLALALPSAAIAQDLIPSKRMVLQQDTDYAGGDIASIFDTTLDACQRACFANTACEAFTFNTRNNSCFPKAGGYEST